MITPKPTDSVKKIWPAAASQVCGLASAGEVRVPHVAEAVDHVLLGIVGSGVPSVSTRPSTIRAQTAIAGIAH